MGEGARELNVDLIVPVVANPGHPVVVNEDIGMETEERKKEEKYRKEIEEGKEIGGRSMGRRKRRRTRRRRKGRVADCYMYTCTL